MNNLRKSTELLEKRFRSQVSDGFFLDETNPEAISHYLREIGIYAPSEKIIRLEKSGDGNMNLVLRATSEYQHLIIKQSRPWVEKYPEIAAPAQRVEMESLFYMMMQEDSILKSVVPQLIKHDNKSNILILEDLGETSDLSDLYTGVQLQQKEADLLIKFITNLHGRFNRIASSYYITNRGMRQLNHQHIFEIPFNVNNGIALDSYNAGLRSVTNNLLKDNLLQDKAREIGNIYLEDGNTLLQGDFYPGSWLRKDEKVYIVDHEFCFFGHKEFDIGVFVAHLILSNQPTAIIRDILDQYKKQIEIDDALMNSFAGMEILRRLIGIAQLPLKLNLKEKKHLLDVGRELVISHDSSILPI